MLFEELELAVKWDRPSLLLAVYQSEAVRAKAEKRLATRLTRLHQRINALPVDESHYDIALELIGAKPAGKVFFVSNLIYGGGKNSADAYRALNIRRELLIENKTRVIFWLADYEFSLLPYFAPDFWAFRPSRFSKTYDVKNMLQKALDDWKNTYGVTTPLLWVNDFSDLMKRSFPILPAGWTRSMGTPPTQDSAVLLNGSPNPVTSDPDLATLQREAIEASFSASVPDAIYGGHPHEPRHQ